jgi:hypothetical protein
MLQSFAGPVSCESGSRHMGSILEEDTDFFGSGFGYGIHPPTINKECQDAEVCVYPCPCGKNVYFKDFTSHPNAVLSKKLAKAYLQVCVRKIIKNEDNKPSWINQKLLDIAAKLKVTNEANRPGTGLTAKLPLNGIFWRFGRTHEDSYKFLNLITYILFSFEKMCSEDKNWQDKVKEKVNDYLDREDSDINERFSGNEYLKESFIRKLKESWVLFNKVKKENPEIFNSMKKAKSELKDVFVQHITNKNGKASVCKCSDIMTEFGSDVPNDFKNKILNECSSKCSNSTILESDDLEELDDEE